MSAKPPSIVSMVNLCRTQSCACTPGPAEHPPADRVPCHKARAKPVDDLIDSERSERFTLSASLSVPSDCSTVSRHSRSRCPATCPAQLPRTADRPGLVLTDRSSMRLCPHRRTHRRRVRGYLYVFVDVSRRIRHETSEVERRSTQEHRLRAGTNDGSLECVYGLAEEGERGPTVLPRLVRPETALQWVLGLPGTPLRWIHCPVRPPQGWAAEPSSVSRPTS